MKLPRLQEVRKLLLCVISNHDDAIDTATMVISKGIDQVLKRRLS